MNNPQTQGRAYRALSIHHHTEVPIPHGPNIKATHEDPPSGRRAGVHTGISEIKERR